MNRSIFLSRYPFQQQQSHTFLRLLQKLAAKQHFIIECHESDHDIVMMTMMIIERSVGRGLMTRSESIKSRVEEVEAEVIQVDLDRVPGIDHEVDLQSEEYQNQQIK